MRRTGIFGLALVAASSLGLGMASSSQAALTSEQTAVRASPGAAKRKRQTHAAVLGYSRIRSRGPQAKPKKKPNRLTISRRVRRKARRAK